MGEVVEVSSSLGIAVHVKVSICTLKKTIMSIPSNV